MDEGRILNKGQGKKLSVRFKGFLNLSQTINFVTDWANAKSMVKVHDKIQFLNFVMDWANAKSMVQDKFVSDFLSSFFICLRPFYAYHH